MTGAEAVAFIIWCSANLLWVLMCDILFTRIKKKDPINYAKLGRPSLTNPWGSVIPLTKMLFTSRYLPQDRFCRSYFNFMRVYLAAILLADAVFVYRVAWGAWSRV